jgi:hypothetical protein
MPLTHYSKFSVFTLRIWVFKSGVLEILFILSKHGTKANIRSTKMANNRHAYNRDVLQSYWTSDGLYHYTVFSRQVRKHTQTNNVKDLPRSGRPRVKSDRDDRALQRLVRRMSFATSPVFNIKQHWLPNRRLSTRTIRNRLKSAGLKSRRVIKRPLLSDRHRRSRLAWCLARRGWNFRTWRNIHWSDESRFLLHVTDGRMRVWRHKHTAYTPKEHQSNCPLRWRLSNGLGVYLSWLQAGCSRYWTLNNRCRQVIHKWGFESEMTILSCFLNCEGQCLKWTCFTAKTGLVILWLNIH